jgi:uncharacterized protein
MNNNNPLFETFNGSLRVAVIGVLAILALFLLAETIDATADFGRPAVSASDTITVTGEGQATLAPDVANITFTVQNTAAEVAGAQSETTQQANAALAFVKGAGVADADVQATSYNISPQYSYPTPCSSAGIPCMAGGVPKITGYQVSETIQVTVRDLSTVGSILSGLGNLNVQNINGPNFTLDNPAAGDDAARANAISNAKQQAQLLAAQLGVRLGKIVTFTDSSDNDLTPPLPFAMNAAAGAPAAVSAPNVPTGENTYTSSVSITYEIN